MNDILHQAGEQAIGIAVASLLAIALGVVRKLFTSQKLDVQTLKTAAIESAEAEKDRLMERAVLAVEEKFAKCPPAPLTKKAEALHLFEEQGGKIDFGTDALLHATVARLPGIGASANSLRERVAD